MRFIGNTLLAALVAALLLAAGLGHYDGERFAAATHPLSQSHVLAWMDLKRDRARSIPSAKIVLASGKSGLFGLRCEAFTQELGAPCVNGGMLVDLALEDLLAFDRGLIRPGDVVLLQLEYSMYFAPPVRKKTTLSARLFPIDLGYLLSSVSEHVLAATGYSFFGPVMATPAGDRRGHSRANVTQLAGQRARETLALAAARPTGVIAPDTQSQLAAFFAWAKDSRVLVVGTVQPSYADWTVPPAWLASIRQLYSDAGLPFAVLPNGNRYPRDCFWDTSDRLAEECQISHSKALAGILKPILAERAYGFPRDAGR
jgi:hypothetical protein